MSDNIKVCWNCDHYDSFGTICTYYGIVKQANDTCDKFTDKILDDMRLEIVKLRTRNEILKKENELLLDRLNSLMDIVINN